MYDLATARFLNPQTLVAAGGDKAFGVFDDPDPIILAAMAPWSPTMATRIEFRCWRSADKGLTAFSPQLTTTRPFYSPLGT